MQITRATAYLLRCASQGVEADYIKEFAAVSDRVIEAHWIRDMLLGHPLTCEVHQETKAAYPDYVLPAGDAPVEFGPRSLRIRGAQVSDKLDLEWCGSAHQPLPSLCCMECRFGDMKGALASIKLSNAHLCGLALMGSHLADLRGVGMRVDGLVNLSRTRLANVDLENAHLGGLELTDSKLTHLRAVDVRVDGLVDLSRIRPLEDHDQALCWCKLSRAVIAGHLLADGVQLRAPKRERKDETADYDKKYDFFELDWGINLYMSRIAGLVMIRKNPKIDGGILLDSAHVQGDVRIDSATVLPRDRSNAIALERASIDGSLTFARDPGVEHGLRCEGPIWMWLATIGGSFDLIDAKVQGNFQGDSKDKVEIALYAEGATVRGWVRLEDVMARGLICLHGMHGNGVLHLSRVQIKEGSSQLPDWFTLPHWLSRSADGKHEPFALDARGAHVVTVLQLKNNSFGGAIDLSDAHCATLDDNLSGYGRATAIMIDGFRYGRLENARFKEGDRRERWLPVGAYYQPHPYVQLAQVFASHGFDTEARKILVRKAELDAKRDWYNLPDGDGGARLARTLRLWVRRFFYFLFICPYRSFFDFGLSPPKAAGALLGSILLGTAMFGLMDYRNAMVVAQTPVAGYVNESDPEGAKFVAARGVDPGVGDILCGQTIRRLVYAVDVFIPLVDLREEGKCDIAAANVPSPPYAWEVTLYRLLKAAYAVIGWIVTTLALLTFSGVMRHRLSHD